MLAQVKAAGEVPVCANVIRPTIEGALEGNGSSLRERECQSARAPSITKVSQRPARMS